jgi:hypothetical protein
MPKVHDNLNKVLVNQKKQLIRYMESVQAKARSIHQDELMYTFFKAKRDYYHANQTMEIPERITQKIENLKSVIKEHYLHNYLQFYDILFIDQEGEIFYTIRKEKDYHQNIFSETFKNTALSRKLKENPSESFVDFQFYKFSGEPSAFFIEPVRDGKKCIGWFVFQCAINKINRMFMMEEKLGATGEVILVNKNHYMLTDSRFKAESTILKQKLSAKNIESKFEEEKGYKAVIDYKGDEVFSAFEVFTFLGSKWLIIAKINKEEVITDYYQEHAEELGSLFHRCLIEKKPMLDGKNILEGPRIDVDIEEFTRSRDDKILYTHGVSKCTAIVVNYPGKFSYMAHVSPFDKIYGNNRTDLLGHVLKRLTYFEITRSEKPNIRFTVVSPHAKTIKNIAHELIGEGYFLSQLTFMHNPDAAYGNIYHDVHTGVVSVSWLMDRGTNHYNSQQSTNVQSIGEKMKQELIATNKEL